MIAVRGYAAGRGEKKILRDVFEKGHLVVPATSAQGHRQLFHSSITSTLGRWKGETSHQVEEAIDQFTGSDDHGVRCGGDGRAGMAASGQGTSDLAALHAHGETAAGIRQPVFLRAQRAMTGASSSVDLVKRIRSL